MRIVFDHRNRCFVLMSGDEEILIIEGPTIDAMRMGVENPFCDVDEAALDEVPDWM